MPPLKFSEHITIAGKPESIFDYTQDYNSRLKWDTFLIEAYLMDGAAQADKGAKAWCVAKNGLGMETQYVSFNRPNVTAVKMTKGPYMFKDFAASWTFHSINSEETKVTFTYSFRLRFPYSWIGFIIRLILQKNVRQRLKDLKTKFGETVPV